MEELGALNDVQLAEKREKQGRQPEMVVQLDLKVRMLLCARRLSRMERLCLVTKRKKVHDLSKTKPKWGMACMLCDTSDGDVNRHWRSFCSFCFHSYDALNLADLVDEYHNYHTSSKDLHYSYLDQGSDFYTVPFAPGLCLPGTGNA